jgi:hypothetical protein
VTIRTSVACDHSAPPCRERLDLEVPPTMFRSIEAELRRAGWKQLRSGDFCPAHADRKTRP